MSALEFIESDQRASAKRFIDENWNFIRSEVPPRECDGLIDYWIESKRVFPDLERIEFLSRVISVPSVMAQLCVLPSGPSSLRKLRQEANEQIRDRKHYFEAAEHLIKAAKILGLRDTFFIHIDQNSKRAQKRPTFEFDQHPKGGTALRIHSSTKVFDAPRVEGETSEEYAARTKFGNMVKLHNRDDPSFGYRPYLEYDRTNGRGGTKDETDRIAIRMLWDAWPVELQKTERGRWLPKKVAAQILNFCGHPAISNDIGKYADEQRRK